MMAIADYGKRIRKNRTFVIGGEERSLRLIMGMTIEEAIEEVQQQKLDYQEFWEEYKNEHIEALNMAIDTMRKYQKIQEIINNTDYIEEDVIRYKMICEVVKDGNVD